MKLLAAATVCLLLAASSVAAAGSGLPKPGQPAGRIVINADGVNINSEVVQGTKNDAAVPGVLPVHYRTTNLPCEGQTVVISGHHYSHWVPGTDGGVFRHIDRLRKGDRFYITCLAMFGGGRQEYLVTSNRSVDCGRTPSGFWDCPPALKLMPKRLFTQTKVYIITCIGDGYARRIITAFAVMKKPKA